VNRDLVERSAQLFGGLICVGLGVALMVDANLGLSPWDVLHQGLHEHTSVGIGTISIGLGLLLFGFWIPLRQRVRPGTLVNIVTIGVTINLFLDVDFHPRSMMARIATCVAGDVIVSTGGGLYIGAGLGTGPRDGIMIGVVERGFPLRTVRTILELAVLGFGWLLGGSVGFGTVLFAFTLGPILHFVLSRTDRGHYGATSPAEDDLGRDVFPPPAVS
jgi:uncharacterized membrane protein YczE